MYDDPANIRKHRFNVSLNDDQKRKVEAVADWKKTQKTVLLMELGMRGIEALFHELNHASGAEKMRPTHLSHVRTFE